MSDSYQAKVNNQDEFSITTESISALDIIEVSKNNFHILHHKQPFKATILKGDINTKTYQVLVNNNKYEVQLKDDLDILIDKMGFSIGKTKKVNEIKAPMPGLILDIIVEIGQEVKEDETLLILEAMKMENSISSPRNGVIKTIGIKKGEAVDKGALLIEFEA